MNAPAHNQNKAAAGTPVTQLYGVGEALAKKLTKLNIYTVEDLLFLLPIRYEDRTQLVPLNQLRAGERIAVEGTIESVQVLFRGRRQLQIVIADQGAKLILRFFYFSNSQKARFVQDGRVRCFGEVRSSKQGMQMIHPTCRMLSDAEAEALDDTLTPIYPATEGLQQARLKGLTTQALNLLGKSIELSAVLPDAITEALGPSLYEAIRYLHRPPKEADVALLHAHRDPHQRRLAFEELLAQYLSLRQLRARLRQDTAPALAHNDQLSERFTKALPFTLTGAQARVKQEIVQDLVQPVPMMRLLQGDVGSGKTVVAALAACQAMEAGQQVALLAPTELLAEQHLQTFSAWFEPLGISVVWLSGKLKAAERRHALSDMRSGRAQCVVGTHALFQAEVKFKSLGLMIVDEQHRFGVQQRLQLREKGQADNAPHQLVMTATPIPRTLAMTLYADLDVSVLDEKPAGRLPILTAAVINTRRGDVVERVRLACEAGQQVYWVCPLVEESEKLQAQAAEETFAMLTASLSGLNIGLVHGRLKSEQKEQVMSAFKQHQLDVLVATTVVEVGVDVPNASLMIIENAERMGLAQLHQLRGRVGRSDQQSHCVLLYQGPLSKIAKSRLTVMRETNDGFVIAQKDFELRGAGEVLGTKQTGVVQMRIADIVRDADLMPMVQQQADRLLQDGVDLEPLLDRWVGEKRHYAQV